MLYSNFHFLASEGGGEAKKRAKCTPFFVQKVNSADSDQTGLHCLPLEAYLSKNLGSLIRVSSYYLFPLKLKTNTVMILNFRTDRSGQTVQTQIRLLLVEQSDQGLHYLHVFEKISSGLASLFEF